MKVNVLDGKFGHVTDDVGDALAGVPPVVGQVPDSIFKFQVCTDLRYHHGIGYTLGPCKGSQLSTWWSSC